MSSVPEQQTSLGVCVPCAGVEEQEGVEPEGWGSEGGAVVGGSSLSPAPSTSALQYQFYPTYPLANGLRNHEDQLPACQPTGSETLVLSGQVHAHLSLTDTHTVPPPANALTHAAADSEMDSHTPTPTNVPNAAPSRTRPHPAPPSTPVEPNPLHDQGHTPFPAALDSDRKYRLRSSGRPRFPSRLRKSSRLRRGPSEEHDRRTEREEQDGGTREDALPVAPHKPLSVPLLPAASSCLPAPEGSAPRRRRGRFVGMRRIVVKVPRIPVHLSRRQKSYKISSLDPGSGIARRESTGGLSCDGGEGEGSVREPTALLRMKNNGKSVMVMFPPGELPVILKRRRGRPPKQAPPGQPDLKETRAAAAAIAAGGGTGDGQKKPRRRRRVKLPSPQPCYASETNDVRAEYSDVLSKLAFLTHQPPPTARCSPPRCWTPTLPESAHAPPENPGLPALLQRLSGFRRRGGRGGGVGSRGGGVAGGRVDAHKSSFSDFFEMIGKKRKPPPSELGVARKRGKGGGVGGGGGLGRLEMAEQAGRGADKPPRKRRSRKNGALKGVCGEAGTQDWANGSASWSGKGTLERDRVSVFHGHPFSCSEVGGKGGLYSSSGVRSGAVGEESQGLFAGYFRSLLDSDDSSDLLDISSHSGRKLSQFDGSPHRWSPAFPKHSPKGTAAPAEGGQGAQHPPSNSCAARPPYSYSQTSPPTPAFPKSPALSLSRSPSSPHPAGSYSTFSSSYSGGTHTSTGGGSATFQPPQRIGDSSFGFGLKNPSGSPSSQCQMGYSSYSAQAKRGYGGYSSPAHTTQGPASPGGGYVTGTKVSPFTSSSSCSPPEGCRQYSSTQWGFQSGWGAMQFHTYPEHSGSLVTPESKDILDISNYTPQKAKQRPCSDTLSESSSDSSHMGGVGANKPKDMLVVGPEGQSSLSSLEKLMMDWNENSAGPSYNWSQNVLFQGGAKPGRGRRKRTDTHQAEREGCSTITGPMGSPASPSSQGSAPKRGGVGGRGSRGARIGRSGYSSCQREHPPTPKQQQKPPSGSVFQETLDYYSGDSSSLSPLSHAPEPCEYPSPYSGHASTPSSDERFAQIYPSDSASLSPGLSAQPDTLKPYPKSAQTPHSFCSTSRAFSPTLSPNPRLLTQCGSTPSKEQFSQYDSPSYSSSPCWYSSHSYEDPRTPPKRDLPIMSPGLRVPPPAPYPSPMHRGHTHTACDTEDLGYPQGGVLCQLLDQPSDESFTVTSL
ncbi:AT-hook DNA-binding motif-containing protein 1 [Denticeps clupeoides]|uniref:DUF4683 domain-containing protein n=1 Tax=Denticeps clupeoides TaxID=299321 RepID=A0AAY4BXM9_9TELE|nr:AT-hook DNA-binding motif-containing protein 1-like [Denticeps clupeoides]